MTEEEIRPIAEDYVEEYCHCPDGEYTDGSLVCAGIGTALIVSRQLEKRIAELEKEKAEIEEEINKIGKSAGFLCNQELKQQIKEAKEIIKNLLIIHNDTFGNTDLKWRCNIIAEAENFYKEE